MKNVHEIAHWQNLLNKTKQESEYAAYGWFASDGKLLSANKTMCRFLDTNETDLNPLNQFINPDFEKLGRISTNDELIFNGILTIGNFADTSFSVTAKVYRHDEIYFVFAEADADSLLQHNTKMSRMNQEISTLQRKLIREKTRLEQTLQELKETQQMLVHSEKMNALGKMVAGIAHEINNPLAFVTNNIYEFEKCSLDLIDAFRAVRGVTSGSESETGSKVREICQRYQVEFISDDMKELLVDTKNGVDRVKTIIEDLRKFSRLDESEIKHTDIVDSFRSTLSIVHSEIDKKQIKLSFSPADKIMIDCYPGQLNQAILNLLINAIQAVETGGVINFDVEAREHDTAITIADNGCGISEDDKEKIFDPFFTTKPVGSGTGLGLSITHKIITGLHRGTIEVSSEINKGSVFTITLPKVINT